MEEKSVPIKLSVLRVLHRGLEPIKNRLECFMEDYYTKRILLSQAELTALLELRTAAATVELLLTDYFEQAEEFNVDTLYLPSAEFHLLLDLSKTTELGYRVPIANSGLWAH